MLQPLAVACYYVRQTTGSTHLLHQQGLQDSIPRLDVHALTAVCALHCSPAAQATVAQLKILTQLERSVVRLASAQPPLFQPPPGQQLQPAASLQVLLQRSGSPHAGLGGPAPQLTLLPGINIQVRLAVTPSSISRQPSGCLLKM